MFYWANIQTTTTTGSRRCLPDLNYATRTMKIVLLISKLVRSSSDPCHHVIHELNLDIHGDKTVIQKRMASLCKELHGINVFVYYTTKHEATCPGSNKQSASTKDPIFHFDHAWSKCSLLSILLVSLQHKKNCLSSFK